ncbi:MAG: hypothetical protein HFH76_02750 [Lachnospiraceae bacterium]|nr:hypothetical protein [Lachnospiraceae bacterium]
MGDSGDKIVKDALLVSNFQWLYEKKIVLYGAGERGNEAYEILSQLEGAEIIAYCETDADKWRRDNQRNEKNGIAVCSLDSLSEIKDIDDILFVITTKSEQNEQNIISTIEQTYSEINLVVTWTAFFLTVFLNIKDERFKVSYQRWFLERNLLRVNSLMAEFIDSSFEHAMENEAILVYQPGKVGSFSLYQSLRREKIPCAHIHRIVDSDGENTKYYTRYPELYRLWGDRLREVGGKKIITMVRDPIRRSVSAMFHGIYQDCIDDIETGKGLYDNTVSHIVKDADCGTSGKMFEWFHEELEKATGIDIFKYEFNKEAGYGIIREDGIEILILVMEKMNQNANVIRDFVGIDRMKHFTLSRQNVGNEKNYKYLYRAVIESLQIPSRVLDFYYRDNAGMQHFYTDKDIQLFCSSYNTNGI